MKETIHLGTGEAEEVEQLRHQLALAQEELRKAAAWNIDLQRDLEEARTQVEQAKAALGLAEVDIVKQEEREAWDRYAATVLGTLGDPDYSALPDAVKHAANLADALLAERRKRFGGAK